MHFSKAIESQNRVRCRIGDKSITDLIMSQFSDINKIFKTNNWKINTSLNYGINDIPIQLTLLFSDVSVNLI